MVTLKKINRFVIIALVRQHQNRDEHGLGELDFKLCDPEFVNYPL